MLYRLTRGVRCVQQADLRGVLRVLIGVNDCIPNGWPAEGLAPLRVQAGRSRRRAGKVSAFAREEAQAGRDLPSCAAGIDHTPGDSAAAPHLRAACARKRERAPLFCCKRARSPHNTSSRPPNAESL